jgi:pSer/pThr/pTyr-binding forkhead associated (FHA) protein
MSFVIIGGERYALEFGDTVLGGEGGGTLNAREAAHLPPVVVISFPMDGPSTARSLSALPVTLNGVALHSVPHPLRHGDRLEVSGLVIAYGDMRKAGRTSHIAALPEATPPTALLQSSQAAPTACTGGRLMRLGDRAAFAVPDGGLTLGRDPSSDIVLTSAGVSRTHAVIVPSLLGYTLKDQSANGVWVNGARVEGLHVLGQGDVLRLGHEEFRFEADEASFEPSVPAPEESLPSAPARAASPPRAKAARLLATLEVLSDGPTKGERFRIDRPTVQMGRGAHNEVRLDNESVSTSHASLVQRGNRWVVLDLGSRNGTFVDGEMVREQCELPSACELRLGMLTLLFRVINAGEPATNSTINVIGMSGE